MITFNNLRFLTESIRQGLPAISTMKPGDFHNLIHKGKVPVHSVTEKTDGSTFKFGHDEHGFYSQSSGSGSERMRTPEDYRARVDRRAKETGQEPDYTGADAFAKAHASLQKNQRLLDHLRAHHAQHGTAEVRGELFSHHLSRPSDTQKGEVKLVGTSYDPKRWGKTGQVVIHSKLPENEKHDTEHFKKNLSSDEINFEDDKVDHKPSHVDVSEELADHQKLNHDLINSRTTKTNKAAKEAELEKLKAIQKRVSDKVDNHVRSLGIKPKFGSGTEGLVVHPKPGSTTPRFKVTSDAFRQHEDFKKRLQKEEYSLITEGGNIKVKTPEGEVSAAPFKVRDRAEQSRHIRQALQDIHTAFREAHGEHLFGKNADALNRGAVYGGSTKDFMDRVNIPDKEFTKHKPSVGDIDVQVSHDHKNKLASVLIPGTRHGSYTVVGTKKHGNEISAVMRHDNGEHHQFDFEGVDTDENGPTRASQFLHSSNWEDTKKGIKGSHHKILLNAIGGDTHKFSITHGLRSRTDETDPGSKNPEEVSGRLFGDKADHSKVHSFGGIAELIRDHVPPERHQQIYDKFRDSVSKMKDTDHGPALAHLRNTLGVKDVMKEEAEETHHVHVSFLGAAPFPHMGHHRDIVGSMEKAPRGRRFVGLSGKSQAFTDKEREDIANKQSGGRAEFKVEKTAGQTVGRAHGSVADRSGKKILHLHFGHDRKAFAEGLKKSIEAGKIPEMGGGRFHEVHVHYPEDTDRSHGMSGTKMRKAAHEDNLEEFHRHIGPNFTRGEARKLMHKVKKNISSGSIPLLRENHINIGQTLDRSIMPQINDHNNFKSFLKQKDISHITKKVDGKELKSSQLGFDKDKVFSLMNNPSDKPIVISNDGYVLDGHHRWLANHNNNRKSTALEVDMPILELIRLSREYNSQLTEEMTRKDFGPMLTSFVDFASDKLGIKSKPGVRYKDESDDYNSFAAYNPSKNELSVQTKNRHPMDVMRSVAHELVHHWQKENGKIGKDIAKEGSTGSPQENEANAVAGKIMRWFAKANPDAFSMSHIVEQKEAIFVVGGPCSGKDYIIKQLKESNGSLKELDVNQVGYGLDIGSILVNGSANDYDAISKANDILRDLNFQTALLFVDVENNISKLRNEQRQAKGQRVIAESVRFAKYNQSQENKKRFAELFGDNMSIIDNSNIVTEKVKEPTGDLKKACWKGYTAIGTKKKNGKTVPNCVPVSEADKKFENFMKKSSNRLEGSKSLLKIYKKATPNEMAKDNGFERTTSTHPLVPEEKKKKIIRKVLTQEDGVLDTASGAVGLPVSNGIGPEFGVAKSPSIITGLTGVSPMSQGAYMSVYPFGTYGIAESLKEWALKPETQRRFQAKYGKNAGDKLWETVLNMNDVIKESDSGPKHFNQVRESIDRTAGQLSYPKDNVGLSGSVPSAGRYKDGDFVEEGSTRLDKSAMKCNKPRAQAVGDSLTGKSHVVKACSGGKEKIIRFGQRGVKGSPKKEGESKAYANRRKRFKARHAKNIKKGKMSAAYWSNKVKW